MGNIGVRVEGNGPKEILRELEKLDINTHAKAVAALKAGAKVLEAGARAQAPERSGYTKANIKTFPVKTVKGKVVVDVGVELAEDAVRYPYYVEYGHGGPKAAPPHPFMNVAAEMMEDQVLDAIVKSLMEGL